MLVSVCTIARNEEEYLPHLLEDIKKQDYPAEQIEVVMVDSSSTDGTRRIMECFAEDNPQYHNCYCYRKSGEQSGIWLESGNPLVQPGILLSVWMRMGAFRRILFPRT